MAKNLFILLLILTCLQALLLPKSRQKVTSIPQNNYPVRAGYIDQMTSWYGMDVAKGLGLPGYAAPHQYNYIIFAFWSCSRGPLDVTLAWQNISMYLGEDNPFGKTDRQIQLGMKKVYNQAGVKVLASAFGDSQFPTTQKQNAQACGTALGNFILKNNLDGADIDWEDNGAMQAGTGEQWLIDFTIALRKVIPDHIVTHCPQAPYFKQEFYKHGAYITVDKAVGDLINFYIIQFYNQGDCKYNTFENLIEKSTEPFTGTAIMEIKKRGIDPRKLIIAKPVLPTDATNTGYIPAQEFRNAVDKAYSMYNWYGGVAHWQYPSDLTGNTLRTIASGLIDSCKANPKNCR